MLPEFIKYSNFNSTFNRKKMLTERDNMKRMLFLKIEFYTLIKKIVVANKYVSKTANHIIQIKLRKLTKRNNFTSPTNRCL